MMNHIDNIENDKEGGDEQAPWGPPSSGETNRQIFSVPYSGTFLAGYVLAASL
jgi:hypothetical protein